MPFIVCDRPVASESVECYILAGLPGNPTSPLEPQGSQYGVKFDVTNIPAGTYDVRVSACNKWACSLPSPLEFIRPENATEPINLRLVS